MTAKLNQLKNKLLTGSDSEQSPYKVAAVSVCVKDYINSLGVRLGDVRRVSKSTEEVGRGSDWGGLGFSLLAAPSTTCGPDTSRSRQEARVKSRDKSFVEVYL
jgi:hypothetical protein